MREPQLPSSAPRVEVPVPAAISEPIVGRTSDAAEGSHRKVESLLTLPLARTTTVLVVEDSTDHQKAICDALRRMGVATDGRVEMVDNAEDALKALLGGSFDLVILDQSFPQRSGEVSDESTLSNLLRELRTKSGISVKAVTNSTNLSDNPKSGEFNDYQELCIQAENAGVHIVGSLEKGAPDLSVAKKLLSKALHFEG